MFDLLTPTLAWAEEAAAPAAGSSGPGLAGLLQSPLPMLILMFAVFYFLLIRPQQKKAKQHKEMLANLRKGDDVLTGGGIYGKITGIADEVVVVEIAPQVRVKMARSHVQAVNPGAPAQDKDKK